jgi:hypothetical protein
MPSSVTKRFTEIAGAVGCFARQTKSGSLPRPRPSPGQHVGPSLADVSGHDQAVRNSGDGRVGQTRGVQMDRGRDPPPGTWRLTRSKPCCHPSRTRAPSMSASVENGLRSRPLSWPGSDERAASLVDNALAASMERSALDSRHRRVGIIPTR